MANTAGAALEIERRFLIRIPSPSVLRGYGASARRITQTYLVTPPGFSSERVRKSESEGVAVFTHTRKLRIAKETAIEQEREIGESEYGVLLGRADPLRAVIRKTRSAFVLDGLCYEIDVYPQWEKTAILEIELPSASAEIRIPDGIEVILEITGDARYANHALALAFPPEPSA